MIQKYTIPGRFLTRNESEKLSRTHWSRANEVKRDETERSCLHAMAAGLVPMTGPVDVTVIFTEKAERYKKGTLKKLHDVDNVHGGEKAVIDGLVKAGVVPDDGPEWVRRAIPVVRFSEDEEAHITVVVADYSPELTIRFPPVDIPEEKG